MYEPIVGEKQCSKCHQCKPLTMFDTEMSSRTGYKSDCKACRGERERERYMERKAAGIIRSRIPAQPVPAWPLPTHTLADGLSCVKLRAWRGPVEQGFVGARL
ncbi:MAG: hypothetical protein M3Q96_05895 [Pseudomonadota bacterium]|nr:hypothetical protein [Pseudomonadota bacterium]